MSRRELPLAPHKKDVTLDTESVIAELYDTSIRTWPADRARSADWTWSANRARSTDKAGTWAATGATEVTETQAQAGQKRARSATGSEKAPAKTLIWWPWYIGRKPVA
jgi:hypothetical protein